MANASGILDAVNKFFATKQYDRAIESLERLAKSDPADVNIMLRLADAYYLYGNDFKCISLLRCVARKYAKFGFMNKALAVKSKIEKINPRVKIWIPESLDKSSSFEKHQTIEEFVLVENLKPAMATA